MIPRRANLIFAPTAMVARYTLFQPHCAERVKDHAYKHDTGIGARPAKAILDASQRLVEPLDRYQCQATADNARDGRAAGPVQSRLGQRGPLAIQRPRNPGTTTGWGNRLGLVAQAKPYVKGAEILGH